MKTNDKLWNTNKAIRKFMVMNYDINESMTGTVDFKNGKNKFGVNKFLNDRYFNIVDNEKNTLILNRKAYQMLRETGVELEELVF